MSKELSIAQKQELVKKQNFQEQIQKTNKAFIEIYGEKGHKVFLREQQYASMAVQKNPEILNCTPNSIYTSVAAVAMTGLSLDPTKQLAHLVPRKGVCTLVIDYKGFLDLLLKDTGVRCSSGAVYDCDTNPMDFKEGLNGYVNSTRAIPRPEKRTLLYCYNIALFPDGTTHCFIMDKEQIEKRKDKATTQKVWDEWEEEMSIKTVVRAHYKFLPKSEKLDEVMSLVDEELPKFEKKTNDDDDFLNDDVQTPEGSITIEPDTSNTENQ